MKDLNPHTDDISREKADTFTGQSNEQECVPTCPNCRPQQLSSPELERPVLRTEDHTMSSVPITQHRESLEEESVSDLGVCGCVSGHAFE